MNSKIFDVILIFSIRSFFLVWNRTLIWGSHRRHHYSTFIVISAHLAHISSYTSFQIPELQTVPARRISSWIEAAMTTNREISPVVIPDRSGEHKNQSSRSTRFLNDAEKNYFIFEDRVRWPCAEKEKEWPWSANINMREQWKWKASNRRHFNFRKLSHCGWIYFSIQTNREQ